MSPTSYLAALPRDVWADRKPISLIIVTDSAPFVNRFCLRKKFFLKTPPLAISERLCYTENMEYCVNGGVLTPKERNLLIRYCVSAATRGRCATKALLRPLRQKDLQSAFKEQQGEHLARIEDYKRRAKEYDPASSKLPEGMLAYFGGVPAKEEFSRYCREIVRQERDVVRSLERGYSVCVDYAYIDRKQLAFHRSLNPRVTFGYSNSLHEECDFLFDDEKRTAFLRSSLADLPQGKGDWVHDWGNVMFGDMALCYEDLALFRGEACILETVSHEEMMTVRLEEQDLAALKKQGGGRLVEKLRGL